MLGTRYKDWWELAIEVLWLQMMGIEAVGGLSETDLDGVPDGLKAAVLQRVNGEMERLRSEFEAKFVSQERSMLDRIETLHSRLK